MTIEITNEDLKTLAELVFFSESIINEERGQKPIIKYSRVKDKILSAYRSTLDTERQTYFANEENEFNHYISITANYRLQFETAFLIYNLSAQFGELLIANGKEELVEKITKWRRISRNLLQMLIKS